MIAHPEPGVTCRTPNSALDRFSLFLTADSLLQDYLHNFAHFFSYGSADLQFYGQHMSSVAHCHEGTLERMAVDRTFNLHQATRTEKLDGVGPDHIRPSGFVAFLQFGRKRFSQLVLRNQPLPKAGSHAAILLETLVLQRR
jgi:hypothetical protein